MTLTTACTFEYLKVTVLAPGFFKVMSHPPWLSVVAVAESAGSTVAVTVPVALFGKAVTLTFTTSFTLPLMVDGVAFSVVMWLSSVLMEPVFSS